jgi:hypothetical protein
MGFKPMLLGMVSEHYNTKLRCLSIEVWMSDIAYQIKLYSDLRYYVKLRSLSRISEILISGSV